VSEPLRVLEDARRRHYEDPDGALDDARACGRIARHAYDGVLAGRALTLEAAIALQHGDLQAALELLAAAESYAEEGDPTLLAELGAVRSHLAFFAGSYAESLLQAERAVELADSLADPGLQVFTRRSACLVFGNVGVKDWPGRLADLLRLTVEAGDRWEEAMSRNDLAHLLMVDGDLAGAERQMDHAHAIAAELAPRNRFLLGVLSCTRAEMRLTAGRPQDALADTRRAVQLLLGGGDPNPYVLAVAALVEVQALVALGRLDDAVSASRRIVAHLGDRVPQIRSQIHAAVAAALRAGGRAEEAYDELAAGAELERRAFDQLSELQRGLERAAHETRAARRESSALAARNRRLEAVHERLRDQADRDALTGLHNRRFLSRELRRHAATPGGGPFSIAVLDLDHFKHVNDRFGHEVGDHVLIRVAALLLGELREQDVVVRTGGEEFVLLMPHTGARAAIAVCERLRMTVGREPWELIAPGMRVTMSVGVETAADTSDLESLATRADRRLYEAKRAGRDRVVPAAPELVVC
jgi:diguanylate cyclase (GGDEF)-like protein